MNDIIEKEKANMVIATVIPLGLGTNKTFTRTRSRD